MATNNKDKKKQTGTWTPGGSNPTGDKKYSGKTSAGTKQASSWTPGGSNPTGEKKYSANGVKTTANKASTSTWTPGGTNPTGAKKYSESKVKVTTQPKKWYSGATPTARETLARMYEVANGDREKFSELEKKFIAEQQDRGSIIYNPYAQVTNSKAVDGLRQLGVDVPDKVTDEWIDGMWRQFGQYSRETTTGYGPGAPTKSSTVENDIAYWVNTLMEDKENTNLAEAQMQGMYTQVEYLAKQGYSDKEILKRVKANKDYDMLWKMDEARLAGDAIRLNRAVNYSGDDTIYGMIWAARNPGASKGDYFVDSVKYTMGQGNKYKPDPNSEAVLDPSNYEGFDPYARGGTLHDMNMKYGATEFNREWLEANRSMLNDPERADDWRAIETGIENSEAAAKEKDALDQWMAKKVESGISADDLADELEALLSGDGKIAYTAPDGSRESISLKTLAKMEDARASGTYLAMGYGVDVTLPNYIAQGMAMIEERDAAAQAEAEAKAEEKGFFEKAGDTLASVSRNVWNWITGDRGALEDVVDAQKSGTMDFQSIEETAKKYAKDMFGVDITGEMPKHVETALKDAIGKANKANLPGASKEDIEAANTAAGVLQDMFNEVVNDPKYRASEEVPVEATEPEPPVDYTTRESWTSVANRKQEEPREGMVEMIPETTSFKGAEDAEDDRAVMLDAYADMCQGGEWNFDTFGWAIQQSDNPVAIKAEIGQAIIDHKTEGAELTGLARSWWDKFGGLVDNTDYPTDYRQVNEAEAHPERFDSRMAFGTQIYDLLQANEQALDIGGRDYASTYAENLMIISEIADGISRMTGGERATDEQAAEYLQLSGAQVEFDRMSNSVSAVLEADARTKGEERRMREISNAGVISRAINGEMTDDDTGAYLAIMTADVSKAAAADTTYQAASEYIHDALGFDSIAESGINFSTGDKRIDATYDKMELLNTGAAIYSEGVTALAQAELDKHMHYAAACGLSLEQFYEKFPEYARTPEQLAAEARVEYNGAWNGFAHTIDGLMATNESILNAGEAVEGGEQRKDELDFSDTLALAVDKLMGTNALNWEKTMYMLQHAWKSEADEQELVRKQYSNDRTKYAADVDKLIADKDAELQRIYENDITAKQRGMSYEDWRIENSDPLLDELMAKRDTATDVFDIGDLRKLQAEQVIAEKTGNIANIDKLVSEYGSDFDQMVYNGTTSLMQTGQFMYMSTVLGGGYAASLISTLTGSGSDAYDRFMQSGDYDASVAASIGTWLVNAAIEKMSFDRFMPEYAGGAQGQKMLAVQSMLQREGAYVLLKKPKMLAKAAGAVMETLAKAGFDAAGEGLEEGLQSIVDSIADNIIYGNEYILSAEQMNEAIRSAGAGALMSIPMSGISTSLFGRPIVTDRHGQAISKAEAQLLPEHDGVQLNAAIDFEATAMAITNSSEALAAIENSSENAAKKQAEQELQTIEAELQEKEAKLAEIQAEHDTAIIALEDVNVEMQDSEAFTEDMGKRMTAAASSVKQTQQQLNDAKAEVVDAQGRKDSAQKQLDDATAKVQQMYDQTMDEAKAKYAKEITDKYYAGDSEAQRAAGEAYQQACRDLEDAKAAEAAARAEAEGAEPGSDERKARGKALLAVDASVEEVENAKAAVDAAYAETAEGKAEAAEDAELAKAEEAAVKAAEEAAADPMNSRKQLAADTEQARMNALRANHDMKRARAGISQKLKSPDSKVREQAVNEWKNLQQQASDAAAEAQELETLFNETDTQKNLRTAIDNMKQYTNEQLLFDSEEGHEDAVKAYAELQAAQAAIDFEKAWNGILNGDVNINSAEYDNIISAYRKTIGRRDQKLSNTPGVDWAYDLEEGAVFTKRDQGQYFAALRGMQYSDEKRMLTDDGGFIVPTETSLIFSKGDYDNPEIYGIIKVTGDNSDYVQQVVTKLEDVLNDEKRTGGLYLDAAMEIIPYLFPEGDVQIYGRTSQGYEVRTGRGARSIGGTADSGNRSDGSSNIQARRNTGEVRRNTGADGVNAVGHNPIEIMRDLTDSIRVGYSPNGPMNNGRKRVSSDILAFYDKRAKGIRVRSKYAGDLGIGLHEFGHAAHARLSTLHATQAMLDALPDSVKKSYTNAELDGEAIAEFVVEYMYGRDRAVRATGEQFVRDFERMIHADPELNAAISKARNQVELWNSASAAERAAAMIKDSNTAQQRDRAASNKGGTKRLIEKFITQVFDANEPLRKLGKNVYDAAKWSRWASERADVLMTQNFIDPEGNIIGKSLTERLDDIGFTADMEMDAVTYGVLQIGLERLEQKKPVFAETEFSRDDMIAAMGEIKERNPIAVQAADVFTGFWNDVMDIWLVPNGLVKEDVRDSLWEMYPHYLPTKRVVDVDWSKKDVKSGTFQLRAAKKGGVSLEVINPFQSIADMVDQAVRSVSRNQVMQEIDAVLSGGGLEWLAKEITEDMAVTKIDTDEVKNAVKTALDSGADVDPDLAADAFNLLDDMEEQWRSTGRSLRPNVIAGRRADGTAFYYQIQQGNEDLFRAAMGSKAAANSLVRAAKKVTSAFTQLTTQMNPAFVLKNITRDLPTSVNTGTWAYTYLDGAAKWMWGLYQIATDSKLYQEFEAAGGGTHTKLSGASEKKLREFRRDVIGKKDALPVRAAKLGMKIITLSSINDIAEVNSRFVEYALGKHDRSTFEGRREAAIASQDVTVDFGMAGANELLQNALAFVPFGRAALNGTYKSVMMIRNIGSSDPRTRRQAATALAKTVINNGIVAALQAYLIGAIFGGNDDDERKQEEYALITDEMKAGNLMIPLDQDKMNAKGYDRPWARIPLPQDAISRAVYAFTLNQMLKTGDADELAVDMMNVVKSLLTDSLPGEVITANISNAMMNRTWYGGEIVSSYLMDSRSGVNQYKDDTPSAFKALSNAIYNVSGKEISPAVLQYVFEQSTGYVGKVVIPLISGNRYTGEWSFEDACKNLVYSFMKNFTLDPLVSNGLSQEYDDVTSKINKIVNEAAEGLPVTYLAYGLTDAEREDAVVEAEILKEGLMKQTKAENNALWQEIRDIEANPRLPESEKTIQVREVRREIDHNTAEALAELGEYMQTYVYRDPWVENVLHLFDTRPTLD